MASLEQFGGEGAGGSTMGLKASESVKTSSCIELACEQEGEQDLVLLGGKEELVGDVLGTDVEIDPMGLLTISILSPDQYRQDKAIQPSFLDPFATKDGVSLGYNHYSRETDYGEFKVANYLSNSYGFGLQFGYPISDVQRLNFDITYDNTDIDIGTLPAREIYDFVSAEGNLFETLSAGVSWQRVTLNRGLFPTDGSSTALSLSATIPGSDINYYRLNLRQRFYQPLSSELVFGFQGEIGYLDAYGDTEQTPFFQNFYAGGPRSLRGFESNTLGPRSTDAPCYEFNYEEGTCPNLVDTDGDGVPDEPYYNPYANNTSRYRDAPIGGNIKIEGSMQLIFKLPFIEDQRSMRSAFFFDFGNVFSDNCKDYQINCYKPSVEDLRYSYGVGVTWITGFGPMSFAISQPTNAGPQERTEEFQFTVGNVFQLI